MYGDAVESIRDGGWRCVWIMRFDTAVESVPKVPDPIEEALQSALQEALREE